jgi:hypothetical protein
VIEVPFNTVEVSRDSVAGTSLLQHECDKLVLAVQTYWRNKSYKYCHSPLAYLQIVLELGLSAGCCREVPQAM